MNRNTSLVGAALLVLVSVTLSVLGTLAFRPTTTQAAQASPTDKRSITVVGTGTSKATPDTVTVQVGVQSQAATAREALDQNGASMQALITKLKEAGIADKDLQTSNFGINPTYDNDGRAVTGYQVSNSVTITIREIAKASELLDKVVSAGANNVSGISFGFADTAALQATAREQALANARTRAEGMAKATGGALGQVLIINETPMLTPMSMTNVMFDRAAGQPVAPIQAGEQSIEAQVQVTFELK